MLLVAAALVALAMGDVVESLAIGAVLVINAALGFAIELRARRAMDALLAYESSEARVRRAGRVEMIDAADLVAGDVVELEEGDAIPADGRLLAASGLRVNEALLTGESLPVDKVVDAQVDQTTPLAERLPMVYSGTTVVRGRGTTLITETGVRTEIGRVGVLLAEVESGKTPLEDRLDHLGHRLVGLTLGVTAVVVGVGVLRGQDLDVMIETGIALAIAAVPEGLPAVATIALAAGLRRMARRNALVRRLAAVEALGATTVVCTDKTGTLTAGQMTVTRLATIDRRLSVTGEGFETKGSFLDGERAVDPTTLTWLRGLLEAAALTTRASLPDANGGPIGDPTDAALFVLSLKGGVDPNRLVQTRPRIDELPFDTALRISASVHEDAGGTHIGRIYVKGAPASVLGRCVECATESATLPLDAAARSAFEERNAETRPAYASS